MPRPGRRVGTGPRVSDGDHPGHQGLAVDDEAAVAVDGPAHGQYIGDGFTIEPTGLRRRQGDDLLESLQVSQRLERLVP